MYKKSFAICMCIIWLFSLAACGIQSEPEKGETIAAQLEEPLVESNSAFAFELFKQLNSQGENVFISPYSISAALGMVYNGASGETKSEMAAALQLAGLSDDSFNKGHKYIYRGLNSHEDVALATGNSIWVKADYAIDQDFIDLNKEVFDAYVSYVDFNKEETATTMNAWAKEQTEGLISQIIEPPIDPATRLILMNAVYFKGDWTTSFDQKRTSFATFTNYRGIEEGVEMMNNREGDFEYMCGNDYKAVRLPYGDGNVAMYVIMPLYGYTVNELIDSFDSTQFDTLKKGLYEVEQLPLRLPKFKLEYGVFSLVEDLKALGMDRAFSSTDGDFSKIAEGLYISDVLHKAVIEVNEVGTEAAAVTAVAMEECCVEEDPVEFIVDRPFMFIIADDLTGSILFIGKIDTFEEY